MPDSVQGQRHTKHEVTEQAGYFPVSGAHPYTVLHEVADPVARILLVGSSALERHLSYRPWVQWARFLANKGFEVLRYDYRGVGESTGVFADMTFESWTNDVASLSVWLRSRGQSAPLILHGLELGGILAAKCFDRGAADALILWSTAANANQVIRSALLRWIGPQQMLKPVDERRPAAHFFRRLDEGGSIEIEGYEWSAELWRESLNFRLPEAMIPPNNPAEFYNKPVHVVTLGKNAAPLVKGGVPGYDEDKDFGWLFTANYHWIASNLGLPVEAP